MRRGWVEVTPVSTFAHATFAPYDAGRALSNAHRPERFAAPEQAPLEDVFTRSGPGFA